MSDEFSEKLLKRFEGRKDLGKKAIYEKYFKTQGLTEKDVMKCFEEIEFNFHVPVGILRPDDDMSKLTDRVQTNNPFKWFLWIGRNEFRGDDLLEELNIRLKEHGTFHNWKTITTFEDLVRAWCGKTPEQKL